MAAITKTSPLTFALAGARTHKQTLSRAVVARAHSKLTSSSFKGKALDSSLSFSRSLVSTRSYTTEATATPPKDEVATLPTFSLDLRGKTAFVAGIADDQGFGWAIAKQLAEAGCTIVLGTWVPALKIFETSLRRGKFDKNRVLSDGSLMTFAKVYPMDAVFDNPEDVPEEVKTNKRYAANSGYTVSEVAEAVKRDFGTVDIVVHSLANGPEVAKPLMETSRKGYLAAVSASSFSFVSMVQRFAPIMNEGGSCISLTYLAAERVVPGYGGGMSSAKAALESDTKVLAYEAGRRHKIRVNTISAGPLGSRAAKSIGFIDEMIAYSYANAPLGEKEMLAKEVGNASLFLLSDMSSAITGQCLHVDNGLSSMAISTDSPIFDHMDAMK